MLQILIPVTPFSDLCTHQAGGATEAPASGGTLAPEALACNLTLTLDSMEDVNGCYIGSASSSERGLWELADSSARVEWQVFLQWLVWGKSQVCAVPQTNSSHGVFLFLFRLPTGGAKRYHGLTARDRRARASLIARHDLGQVCISHSTTTCANPKLFRVTRRWQI